MSQLKARCIDQVLTFENTPVITSGNVNYDSIMFDFCSAWDGFIKTAIFYRSEDEAYYRLLDEANSCIIPNEVLTEKGDIFIGVFGVNGDTTLTSQVLKYKITKGAITENLKPADPTPDIYAQIISEYDSVSKEFKILSQKFADLQNQFDGALGNASQLDGHSADYFATAQSVKNLTNGTTPAGDSEKLGGLDPDAYAKSDHKHEVADIEDFPDSMPASDVKSWAKAETKPEYSYSEIKNLPTIPVAVAVKGNAESSYRTGNVNLTPANIGALSTAGGTVSGNLNVTGSLTNGGNTVLHKGISARVIIGTTAPTDTSSFWVDTNE